MQGIRLNSVEVRGVASIPPSGPIYNAEDPMTGQAARVHTLRAELPGRARAAEEFYRRQRAASVMGKHPRDWRLLESGVHENTPYFVLTGPPGEPLAAHLGNQGITRATLLHTGRTASREELCFGNLNNVSSWTVRNWIRDLAWAVDFLHQQGLVLGNLSPHTVWISCEGAAMIMDPGSGSDLSWHLDGKGAVSSRYEEDTGFLAPEQVMGSPIGPHTDVYALGVILFWLLGGQFPPRPRRDATRIGRYLPLIPLTKQADPALAAICKKATAISPANRYRSADFLRSALAANADDMRAAQQKSSHAARNTLIHSAPPELAAPPSDEPEGGPGVLKSLVAVVVVGAHGLSHTREAIRDATATLQSAGIERARGDSEQLLCHVLQIPRTSLIAYPDLGVSSESAAEFSRLLTRRAAREPLPYILESRSFLDFDLFVGRGVLIPRPETELLVEVVSQFLQSSAGSRAFSSVSQPVRIVDVGTGTGAVAIGLALRHPELEVVATDVSELALAAAQVNVERLAVSSRVHLVHADLLPAAEPHSEHSANREFTSWRGNVTAVVSNPPYIPTAEVQHLQPEVALFEPQLALDGGQDGFRVIQRLVFEARHWLTSGGLLALEVGAGQASTGLTLLGEAGYDNCQTHHDLAGIERVVAGAWMAGAISHRKRPR